jgi:exonuclease SbcD
MRLLFLTDTHIRTASMRSRLDTILDTLEEKLREVAAQAREYHVDAVIHGGDLFDRPDVSVQTVARFATLLADFPVPIYVVAGNHDIFAHNPKTLPRQTRPRFFFCRR